MVITSYVMRYCLDSQQDSALVGAVAPNKEHRYIRSMKNTLLRKATRRDFDTLFMMGFDVWAKGSEASYIEACRTSPKYARGEWFVLEDEDGELVSSLIVYPLAPEQFGIGSIATVPPLRKQGYASKLISETLRYIEKDCLNAVIFLYSDIEPEFYERFKFAPVPALAQRFEASTCMVRGENAGKFLNTADTPDYF